MKRGAKTKKEARSRRQRQAQSQKDQKLLLKRSPQQRKSRRTRLWLLNSILILVLSLGLYFLLAKYPIFANEYSLLIFPVLVKPLNFLTNLIPISLSEVLVILSFLYFTLGLVLALIRRKLAGYLMTLAIFLCLNTSLFILLHSINYHRYPLARTLSLSLGPRSKADLIEFNLYLVTRINEIRPRLNEDEQGVFTFKEGIGVKLAKTQEGYNQLAQQEKIFQDGIKPRVKPVALSSYWSYTGVVGMYFPPLAEANLNQAVPKSDLLFAALHEIAHVKGFAREDEANFIAFLAGINHPDADYLYSSLISSYVYSSNQLYALDQGDYRQVHQQLALGARRDLRAMNQYWDEHEGQVQEASNKINDGFLKLQKQEDGLRSYGRMVDLCLAYYFQRLKK